MNRANAEAQFEKLCELLMDICDERINSDPRDVEIMENIAAMTDEAHRQLHELIQDYDLSPTAGAALLARR